MVPALILFHGVLFAVVPEESQDFGGCNLTTHFMDDVSFVAFVVSGASGFILLSNRQQTRYSPVVVWPMG